MVVGGRGWAGANLRQPLESGKIDEMSRRFQFSVKWILALPAFSGAILAAFLAPAPWTTVGIRSALVVAFGLAVVMLLNGGRRLRGFGAGAALPVSVGAFLAMKPLFFPARDVMGITDYDLATLADLNLNDGFLMDLRFRAGFLLILAAVAGLAGLVLSELAQSTRNDD